MSDQDFFFDEDESPAKDADAKAKPAKESTAKSTSTAARTAAAPAAQSVSMTVAALIGVISLLAGVIIGIVLPVGGGSNIPNPTPGATLPNPGAPGGGGQAPQLSPEQLDQDLPPGHPPIGDGGAPGAPGGSQETTSN